MITKCGCRTGRLLNKPAVGVLRFGDTGEDVWVREIDGRMREPQAGDPPGKENDL